jgi:hypothetical protein
MVGPNLKEVKVFYGSVLMALKSTLYSGKTMACTARLICLSACGYCCEHFVTAQMLEEHLGAYDLVEGRISFAPPGLALDELHVHLEPWDRPCTVDDQYNNVAIMQDAA